MYVGIVYRIFYGELSYIGSTINLKKRIRKHIYNYKNNMSCSSKEIICFDDFEVEVLAEIYYIENHLDKNLRNLEREYMEQYVCINKLRAIVSKEERKKETKEYQKEYEKLDKRKEYKKEYRNSDTHKEYQKEYNKEYKKTDKCKEYKKEYEKSDKRKEYKKEYYLKNKAT